MSKRFIFLLVAFLNVTAAILVFSIQPISTKVVLPYLGGSSMVWNTALMFFQGMLFVSYLYVFLLNRFFTSRRQVFFHVVLVVVALLTLPVSLNWNDDSAQGYPILSLIKALILGIGLPYFVLCATSPLTQRWHAEYYKENPSLAYYLYSFSNAGSLLALISYPFIIEPIFNISYQLNLWTVVFVVFSFFLILVGLLNCNHLSDEKTHENRSVGSKPLRWLLYSFVPSLYLMGVSLHLSIDIAATPFIWVSPLAVYLLTFIIAFAKPDISHTYFLKELLSISLILLAIYFIYSDTLFLFGLHLVGLFFVGLMGHSRLASSRPDPSEIPTFYVWIALGGWLGGIASALVAPSIFNSVLEYPVAVVAACLLIPYEKGDRFKAEDLAIPLAMAACLFLLSKLPISGPIPSYLAFIIAIGILFYLRFRPVGLAVGVFCIIAGHLLAESAGISFSERTFYGVYQIQKHEEGKVRMLVHGTTVHGAQAISGKHEARPIAYYTAEGPMGQTIDAFADRIENVAVIGLGIGTVACYGDEKRKITFYEIDPAIVEIARSRFTYLDKCKEPEIIIGDGRLSIRKEEEGAYDLIVVDAFSSDSIPTHLLSEEAFEEYLYALSDKGALLFHISNRYINLRPVLTNLASSFKLSAYGQSHQPNREQLKLGAFESEWLLVPNKGLHDPINARWELLHPRQNARIWTDDYSNILAALQWERLLTFYQPTPSSFDQAKKTQPAEK